MRIPIWNYTVLTCPKATFRASHNKKNLIQCYTHQVSTSQIEEAKQYKTQYNKPRIVRSRLRVRCGFVVKMDTSTVLEKRVHACTSPSLQYALSDKSYFFLLSSCSIYSPRRSMDGFIPCLHIFLSTRRADAVYGRSRLSWCRKYLPTLSSPSLLHV